MCHLFLQVKWGCHKKIAMHIILNQVCKSYFDKMRSIIEKDINSDKSFILNNISIDLNYDGLLAHLS